MIEERINIKWPKIGASQHRWSALTGVHVATLQKHRRMGTLKAKVIYRGNRPQYLITTDEMKRWLGENYQVPVLR